MLEVPLAWSYSLRGQRGRSRCMAGQLAPPGPHLLCFKIYFLTFLLLWGELAPATCQPDTTSRVLPRRLQLRRGHLRRGLR